MAKFIKLHTLAKDSDKKVKFYISAEEITTIFPVVDERHALGFRSTIVIKGKEQRGYDVTEPMHVILKRLEESTTDETETE